MNREPKLDRAHGFVSAGEYDGRSVSERGGNGRLAKPPLQFSPIDMLALLRRLDILDGWRQL